MNTLQLIQVMEQDPKSRNRFCGVFAADTLPATIPQFPCGLIFNSAPHQEKGTHWLAVYFSSDQEGEFFDSYGNPPDFYRESFKTFMDDHAKTWKYNHRCLQSLSSSTCGQFCLYFIMNRNRGKSLSTIVNSFSKNKSINDHRVSMFVRRYLKLSKPKNGNKDDHQIAVSFVKNKQEKRKKKQ